MFRRVLCENWHTTASIIAFALTFTVFFTTMIRELLTRKKTIDHLANLPLDDALPAPIQSDSTEVK
jgi:hypothetical protein